MSGATVLTPTTAGLFARRVGLLGTEEAFALGALIRSVESDGRRVIRCNLGQPDFPLPAHIADAVVQALREGLTTYCDPQGIPELREAIARSVGAKRRLSIDPERVVVYPGGRPPIGLGQEAYIQEGDEVVYPTPGYPLFESFIPFVGGKPVPLPLREEAGFSLTKEDLEPLLSDATKLIFLNFPSNPTGGVATEQQLAEIAGSILAHTRPEVRVYSDESYEAILFDGAEHVSIASIPGMEARTIIASGVSKTYSWTGGRVGWAIYPTVEEAKVQGLEGAELEVADAAAVQGDRAASAAVRFHAEVAGEGDAAVDSEAADQELAIEVHAQEAALVRDLVAGRQDVEAQAELAGVALAVHAHELGAGQGGQEEEGEEGEGDARHHGLSSGWDQRAQARV